MERLIKQAFSILPVIAFSLFLLFTTNTAYGQGLCTLPPPTGLSITSTSLSSISVTWNAAPNAVMYRISTYDQTNQVALPDAFTSSNTFTIQEVQPDAHQYTISISASACEDGPFGEESSLSFSPPIIIIIDDIVQKSCPDPNVIQVAGNTLTLTLPSNNENGDILARRVRIQKNAAFADFLVWADCYEKIRFCELESFKVIRTPNTSGNTPRVKYQIAGGIPQDFFIVQDGNCPGGSGCQVSIKLKTECQVKSGTCTLENNKESCGQGTGGNARIGGSHSITASNSLLFNALDFKNKESALPRLSVSPNPFSTNVFVQFFTERKNTVSLTLLDATGNIIHTLQESNAAVEGENTLDLSLGDLPDGLYFLMLQTGEQREVTKIVKVTR